MITNAFALHLGQMLAPGMASADGVLVAVSVVAGVVLRAVGAPAPARSGVIVALEIAARSDPSPRPSPAGGEGEVWD